MKKFLFLIMLFTLTTQCTQTQMQRRCSKKPTGLEMKHNRNAPQLIKKVEQEKEAQRCCTKNCASSCLKATADLAEPAAFCAILGCIVKEIWLPILNSKYNWK